MVGTFGHTIGLSFLLPRTFCDLWRIHLRVYTDDIPFLWLRYLPTTAYACDIQHTVHFRWLKATWLARRGK